ncbi:MAG: hypothetical protein QM775_31415 [Pirellulales bacterium]
MPTIRKWNNSAGATPTSCGSTPRRPTLQQVEQKLKAVPQHYQLQSLEADGAGLFESITVRSPGDHVALEISFLGGEDIRQQAEALAEELKATGDNDNRRLAHLADCDARFDIMQFEQLDEAAEADGGDPDEGFDPSTLLVVLNALVGLVDGIGVDPQSGLIV